MATGTASSLQPIREPASPGVELNYIVEFRDGTSSRHGRGDPAFTIQVANQEQWRQLVGGNAYRIAQAYVEGQFEISGDIVEAIRMYEQRPRPRVSQWLFHLAARIHPRGAPLQSKTRAAQNVRFHYDRSNEFYRLFLDSRMVYSCAYFKDLRNSLDEAQVAKLDHICRKLDLQPGESFLDIGCGWGALVRHAAATYGVQAAGCTVAEKQFELALDANKRAGLQNRIRLHLSDYRDFKGRFHKIASVGMFEHVGRPHLAEYFRKMHELLEDGGLFLNHGITRPATVPESAQTLFLRHKAFPGTELEHLGEVIETADRAGFETLDVENLRTHYALTCRAWVQGLERNREACEALVGEETWRTWRLTLAGCAFGFEQGEMDVNQILLAKRGYRQPRRLTREYMYPSS